jgi:pyruvate/2-oxoglutarate dehydrogenase complex dihydrolipoamide dehydrogenase (E3) component
MIVLDGDSIGSELAQCFFRLGVQVIQVEMTVHLLIREDSDVSKIVVARFRNGGIDVRLEHVAKQFIEDNDEKFLIAEHLDNEVSIALDEVLVAIGRVANTHGMVLKR